MQQHDRLTLPADEVANRYAINGGLSAGKARWRCCRGKPDVLPGLAYRSYGFFSISTGITDCNQSKVGYSG